MADAGQSLGHGVTVDEALTRVEQADELLLMVIPDAPKARSGIHNPCADDFTLRVMNSGFALRAPRNDELRC